MSKERMPIPGQNPEEMPQNIPSSEEVKKTKEVATFSPEQIKSIKIKFEEMLKNPEKTEEFYELIKNLPIIFTEKFYRNTGGRNGKNIDCKIEENKIILNGHKWQESDAARGSYPKDRVARKEINFQPFVEIFDRWEGNMFFHSQDKELNFYLSPEDKLSIKAWRSHQDTLGNNLEEQKEYLDKMDKNDGEYEKELARYERDLAEYEEGIEYNERMDKIIENLGGGSLDKPELIDKGKPYLPREGYKNELSANPELIKFDDDDWKIKK